MSDVIGSVRGVASLDSSGFKSGFKEAQANVSEFRDTVTKAATQMKGFETASRDVVRAAKEMTASSAAGMSALAAKMQNLVNSTTGVDRASVKADRSTKSWVKSLERQSASFDRLRGSLDPVFAASKQYEAVLAKVDSAVKSGIVSQSEANKVLDLAADRYLGAGKAAAVMGPKMASAGKKTSGLMANMTPEQQFAMKNFAFQLNQIGQQGAVTGSYLGALSIQLPDMLQSFGFLGILLGGVTAVMGPMVIEMFKGADAAEQNTKQIDRLVGALSDYEKFAQQANSTTAKLRQEFGDFANTMRETSQYLSEVSIGRALETLNTEQFTFFEELKEAVTAVDALSEQTLKFERISKGAFPATAEQILQAREGLEAYAETAQEAAAKVGLVPEQVKAINDSFREISRAQGMVEIRDRSAEALAVIRQFFPEGSKLPPALSNSVVQLERIISASARATANMSGASSEAVALSNNLNYAASSAAVLVANLGAVAPAVAGLGNEVNRVIGDLETKNKQLTYQVEQNVSAAVASLKVQRDVALEQANVAGLSLEQMVDLNTAANNQISRVESLEAANKGLSSTLQDRAKALKEVAKSAGKGKGGASGAQSDLNDLMKEGQRITEAMRTPAEQYRTELGKLQKLLEVGAISQETFNRAVVKAKEGLGETTGLASELADVVSGTFTGMYDSAESVLDDLRDLFQGTLRQMIRDAIANPIRIQASALLGGSGVGGTAGLVNGATTGGGLLGGALSPVSGLTGSLSGAFSGVTGQVLSGNLGGAFNMLQSYTGAATESFSGFAGALGAVAAPIAIAGVLISGFQKKVETLKSGFQVYVDDLDVTVRKMERTTRSRFWGLDKSTSTRYSDAGSAGDPIREAFGAVQDSVIDMSSSLGVAESTFTDFSDSIRLNFKDLDEKERVAELQRGLDQLSDTMAEMALESGGLGRDWKALAKEGEGASAVLTRLSTELASVNATFEYLNKSLFETSLAGAAAADHLVQLFGGLDGFNASVTRYLEAFYSEAERLGFLAGQTTAVLNKLNLSMPNTREQFRALVEAQDLATRKGRETYAALIGLADAMDQLLGSVGEFSAPLRAAMAEAAEAVGVALSDVQQQLQAADTAARAWRQAASSLGDFVRQMQKIVLTPRSSFDTTRDRYRDLVAAARGGDAEAASALPSAAQAMLDAATRTLSRRQFENLAAATLAETESLTDIANAEADKQDVIIDLNRSQIDLLEDLGGTLQYVGNLSVEEIAALGGIKSVLHTVNESIGDYRNAIETFDRFATQIGELTGSQFKEASAKIRDSISSMKSAVVDRFNTQNTKAKDLNDNLLSALKPSSLFGGVFDAKVANPISNLIVSLGGLQDVIKAELKSVRDGLKVLQPKGKKTNTPEPTVDNSGRIDALQSSLRSAVDALAAIEIPPLPAHESGNGGGIAVSADRRRAQEAAAEAGARITELRNQIKSLGGVPRFAFGGYHSGGLAVVGEQGPELMSTRGPVNITSNNNSFGALLRELMEVKSELSGLRGDNQQIGIQANTYAKNTSKILRKFDRDGMPEERV